MIGQIKTYELKVDPYDCGMIPVPRNGEWMRTEDFEAAIESARAEAFRMGQESMKKDAMRAFEQHVCGKDCVCSGCDVPIAYAIEAIPLKDKP